MLPAATTRMSFRIFIGSDVNRRLLVWLCSAPSPPQEGGNKGQEQAGHRGDQVFMVDLH